MPELNGMQVARQLSSSLPQIRILLFTMHNSEQFAADAHKCGAQGYVCKSSGEEKLTAAIEIGRAHV